MTEKVRLFYYALWFAHPILELGIAVVMLRHGLQRKFKFFFGYVVTQIVTFGVIFPAYWHKSPLFYVTYLACTAISVACGFGVIHEVFVDVFRSFHTLRDLGTVLFKWAGLVMLLVACVVSVSSKTADMSPWLNVIFTTQRCVRFIQVGMVLFLLFFAHYLGVSRRQHSFGIALGFGCFSAVELLLIASWAGNHLHNPWMSIVNMIAYNSTLLVWLGYVALKSPVRDASTQLLQPHRWEHSLSDIHYPVPADSLIPMFEGMVDRALSRSQPTVPVPAEKLEARAAAATSQGFGLPTARVSSKS